MCSMAPGYGELQYYLLPQLTLLMLAPDHQAITYNTLSKNKTKTQLLSVDCKAFFSTTCALPLSYNSMMQELAGLEPAYHIVSEAGNSHINNKINSGKKLDWKDITQH